MGHVIRAPQIGESPPIPAAKVFLNGEHVRQALRRVREVGQAIDDRHAGVGGEFDNISVAEDTGHNRIDVP